jgi:hypothetical protein
MKFFKIVFNIVFVLVVLLLWSGSVRFVFDAAQVPDPRFKLDNNHYLMGWPGFLVQYHKDGSSDMIDWKDKNGKLHRVAGINKFAVSDRYIVATIPEGWVAIDRKSLQVWVPFSTLNDLENAVGAKFGNLTFIEEFPWSFRVVHRPWTAWAVTTLIFAVILIGGLWLLSIFSRRCGRQKLSTETG